MEAIYFLATIPVLFFQALNKGKTNACLAIISLMMMLLIPIFVGILLSRKKIIHVALFCEAIMLAVIFMIYGQWVVVVLIAAGIIYYRQKFSGKPA